MDIIGTHTLGSSGQKDRSRFDGEDFLQRSLKLATTKTLPEEEEAVYCKTMSFQQEIPVMRSASSDSRRQEHMLSFSDKPEAIDFTKYVGLDNNSNNNNNNNKSSSLSPFLHQIPPSYYRSSVVGGGGYGGYGGMMMSMQGNLTGVKGPFTLTQWAELEQQALIYKYITANVPVPSALLISIKKSFYPYGSLPPSSFGWGSFHLGFASGNMDPEPGRCRRTDGKKWRCSRDAVPDQKYCERHINRGRHRSRKPVEVQSGQTAAAAVAASKAVTKPQQSVVSGGSNRSNARTSSNRGLPLGGQYNNLSIDPLPNNRVLNPLVSSLYPTKESPAVQQKHHRSNNNPFEFGHISSDSLLNPSSAKNNESSSYLDFSWNQDKHSGSWPEEMKSDWTQLSMSIPIASSSPSSTHNNGQAKIALSPLSLSQEYDSSIQTEESQEAVKKVNTWIPISWGNNSLGGPLGEVLNSTTNSPTLGSSPNSSSVSIPFADSNRNNGGDYFHYTT